MTGSSPHSKFSGRAGIHIQTSHHWVWGQPPNPHCIHPLVLLSSVLSARRADSVSLSDTKSVQASLHPSGFNCPDPPCPYMVSLQDGHLTATSHWILKTIFWGGGGQITTPCMGAALPNSQASPPHPLLGTDRGSPFVRGCH